MLTYSVTTSWDSGVTWEDGPTGLSREEVQQFVAKASPTVDVSESLDGDTIEVRLHYVMWRFVPEQPDRPC